jgi:hypothetical protein
MAYLDLTLAQDGQSASGIWSDPCVKPNTGTIVIRRTASAATGHRSALVPQSQSAGSSAFAGNYILNANGYGGQLAIEGGGTIPVVRLYFDVSGRWETMTDVRFEPVSGTLSFTRPWAGNPGFQKYSGKFSGSMISGTFTDNNHSAASRFNWSASRR